MIQINSAVCYVGPWAHRHTGAMETVGSASIWPHFCRKEAKRPILHLRTIPQGGELRYVAGADSDNVCQEGGTS